MKRVVVIGGGAAGLAAAVAAARAGAPTLLVERHGVLGGMATAALVHSICGLYHLREEPEARMAHGGLPAEVAERLLASGGATGPHRFGRVDLLLHQPAAFARVADELAFGQPGLEVRFHTELAAVETQGRAIRSVELLCRGHRERVEGAVFIDATGDAALAAMAGAECEVAERLQRPAYVFALGGVPPGALEEEARLRLARRLVAAVREGGLPSGALGAHFRATARGGEAFVTVDLDDPPGGPVFAPLCPRSLTALERHGRELAQGLVRFLSEAWPGVYLAALPARVGVRESRRIVGEARVEAADVLCGAQVADAVALSTWPIELRESATGPRLRFPEGGRPCEIPLRALRARGWGNLLAAGRCIAASHEAQAAVRVIGTCLATGQAAGTAAALQALGSDSSAAAVRAVCDTGVPPR